MEKRIDVLTYPFDKTIELEFKTEDLLKWFKLPTFEEIDESYEPGAYKVDLTDNYLLDIVKDEDGNLVDRNGKLISEDAQIELESAVYNAEMSGTISKAIEKDKEALEKILETFSDYFYEYQVMGEGMGFEYPSGDAKGIISVDVGDEVTKIKTYEDIVHAENYVIDGWGIFHVDRYISGRSIKDYIEGNFHNLSKHWELVGDRKPEPNFDNISEFDKKYFEERVKEIEKEFKIDVL